MESDSKEKLRQEIAQLSHLIASHTTTSPTYSWNYANNHPNATPILGRHRPYSSPAIFNGLNLRSQRFPHYPNPFQYLNRSYSEQVFPNVNSTFKKNSNRGSTSIVKNMTVPKNQFSYVKPENKQQQLQSSTVKVNGHDNLAYQGCSNVEAAASTSSKSIYINPSHFVKSEEASSSFVRPHFNPTFKMNSIPPIITRADIGSSTSSVSPLSLGGINTNNTALTISTLSAIHYSNPSPIMSVATSTSIPLVTSSKYKLDRRIKQVPLRKNGGIGKPFSPTKHLTTSPKRKVFNRFSMRLVSGTSTINCHQQSRRTRKSVAQAHKLLHGGYIRKSRKRPPRKVKGKSIVNIDGKRYLSRNGGKTLKCISSGRNSQAVICIEGNQFIKRNGGKSLKRLQSPRCRIKSLSFSQSQNLLLSQSPIQLRLAHRAIAKSKLTLSQRTWRKKRFCVFYNRFGECKKKEGGTCPYIHDRKQLTICPKFVVDKCTDSECKLSHDMKVGRMMPCQFFNKSNCSRENCPYPHVKLTPTKKSKPAHDKEGKSPAKKRVTSPSKKSNKTAMATGNKESRKRDQKVSEEDKNGKARYYDETLTSTPLITIIPRRMPRDLKAEPIDNVNPVPAFHGRVSNVSNKIQCSNDSGEKLVEKVSAVEGTSVSLQHKSNNTNQDLRTRLMSKLSTLRNKKKGSMVSAPAPAPEYLSFR